MSGFTSVLPGARVRTQDGFLGTVERLAQCGSASDGQPDCMIVRSDDGQWRYSLPLMLVTEVTQQAFSPIVTLNLESDQLPHYIYGRIERDKAGRETGVGGEEDGEPDLRIPLAVEELVVQKQPIRLGWIHVHKGVETEEKHISVPVYHEEAVIEHIPADQYDGSGANNPNETIVPVIEERLVVQRQSFVREYIRIRKNIVEQRYDVHDVLRREVVEVTEHRDSPEQGAQPVDEGQ
ncbi:MAG TPA: YsnF/AvaK domain-containing protein [Ktedonobacterales bacterium]